ncbi:MAG: hypothetical protein AAF664_01850 [Planctomycetota bacterium]
MSYAENFEINVQSIRRLLAYLSCEDSCDPKVQRKPDESTITESSHNLKNRPDRRRREKT